MVSKPCGRPGCARVIVKRLPCRLAVARYCSSACAAQHRVALGGHPFQMRTPEAMRRNASKGGQAGAKTKRQQKFQRAAAQVDQFLGRELSHILTYAQLTKLRVLMTRSYLQGHKDGYAKGHTALRIERRRQAAA